MSDFALDDPSFYEDFLIEAQEHFEQIETNFLALEESPGDLDLLNAIFRSVHTIKGAAGNIAARQVRETAAAIELHAREGRLDEALGLVRKLTEDFQAFQREVAV